LKLDIFGNLREWGKVLEILESLNKSQELDEHQSGLARILRYRRNWRLLERVLAYGQDIDRSTDEFFGEVFQVMSDPDLYPEARILAIKAWECMVIKRLKKGRKSDDVSQICRMVEGLDGSGPPIFQEALSTSLESIRMMANHVFRDPENGGNVDIPKIT